jgi:hypothetical protein
MKTLHDNHFKVRLQNQHYFDSRSLINQISQSIDTFPVIWVGYYVMNILVSSSSTKTVEKSYYFLRVAKPAA